MNGFNHTLFEDSITVGCSCGCQYVLKHKNGVDIVIHRDIPEEVELNIAVCVLGNYEDNIYYDPYDESLKQGMPTEFTPGKLGDVALNLWDMISWRCTSEPSSESFLYTWVKDAEFTPREEGDTVYPVGSKYYEDKHYEFKVMNSRFEDLYKDEVQAASPFIYEITGTLLNLLKEGKYPYELTLLQRQANTDDESYSPIMRMADSTDSSILVV